MNLSKYAPAIIQLAIVLVGAFAQLTGKITYLDALQLIPLAANAVLVYLVPLFGPAARSGWKTGAAVVGALATAAVPLLAQGGHISGQQLAIVVLAGLQVFGAHVGVQIRNDATGSGPATSSAGGAPVTELPETVNTTLIPTVT